MPFPFKATYVEFRVGRHSHFTTDHATHKARRHAIGPFFSKAKVAAHQELIQRNVDKLCGRIFAN